MQWLSTVLSTVAFAGACLSAIFSFRAAERAHRDAERLALARGRVMRNEADLESLTEQHRKLQGKFYAAMTTIRRIEEELGEEGAVLAEPHVAPSAGRIGSSIIGARPAAPSTMGCENWGIAAIEGPTSTAARCECDYCVSMREARRQMKAARVDQVRSLLVQKS